MKHIALVGLGLASAAALLALIFGPHAKSTPCRCVTAPGFELIEWRIQEPGTRAWARYRAEDGVPVLLGWESEP